MIVSPGIAIFVETTPIHHAPEDTWFDLISSTLVYSFQAYQQHVSQAFLSAEKSNWLEAQQVDYRIYTEIRVGDRPVMPFGVDDATFWGGAVTIKHSVGLHDPSAAFWYKIRFTEGKSSKITRRARSV